jgi:hypothetical protein
MERKPGFYWLPDMAALLAISDTKRAWYDQQGRDRWRGGSYQDNRDKCFSGNLAAVASAEKLISQIETSGLIKRGTTGYVADVAGEFPLVPAYLAQDPFCMMRKSETELSTDRSPLRVFIDVCVSAQWEPDQLLQRGTALLALVMLLNERRAVELYWYSGMGRAGDRSPVVPIMQISTQPLDIATASHVLASPGFLRYITFAFNVAKGGVAGSVPFPKGYGAKSPQHQALMRDGLEAEPDDLIIFGGDDFDTYMSDPIGFVRDQLAHYSPEMLA